MIVGHKPNGYFVTRDGESRKIEGETRQCVHCSFVWEYVPKSGTRRGFCLRCNGFVCARPDCELEQKRLLALFKLDTGCIPAADVNERLRDAYAKDSRYKVLPSGIVVMNG